MHYTTLSDGALIVVCEGGSSAVDPSDRVLACAFCDRVLARLDTVEAGLLRFCCAGMWRVLPMTTTSPWLTASIPRASASSDALNGQNGFTM